MTTEEKLQHFSEVSMETAREEAEKSHYRIQVCPGCRFGAA